MKITDKAKLGSFVVTDEGYLEGNALTARSGVQRYSGAEMGVVDLKFVDVYRDEIEVFNVASLNTFSKIPITEGHPSEKVTADNWKDHAVGTTGDEVLRDGEFIKIGLKITDKTAVKAIKDGTRELSVGYAANIKWGDGVAPDGSKYQARQTGIVANHIAIVDNARAGHKARIGDNTEFWGATPLIIETKDKQMADQLKTVVLGDSAVNVAIDQAPIIDKYKADQAALIADMSAKNKKKMEEKEAEMAKKDAEIDDLKKKVVDGAALDKLVAARSDLCVKASMIDKDLKIAGLSDTDIRKAAVKSALGDDSIKDKSDAYIDARFDILVEDESKKSGSTDKIADVLGKIVVTNDETADSYAAMLNDMRNPYAEAKSKEA